jgi:carboxyl-terminal processing protease
MQVTGGGAIRLTTALYFTPSGRSIQKEGIKPDIEVEPAKIENLQARAGFREENLRRSITNPNDKPADAKPADKPADVKPGDAKPEAAKPGDAAKPTDAAKPADKKDDKAAAGQPSTDPDEPPKDAVADYQLLRALDLIRGISLYSNRAN